jgi:hypothetical protein
MKYLWSLIIVLCAFTASATSIVPKSLEEMVAESDHIVVATIRAVDMVNARGVPVLSPDARTGPGESNQMRLQLEISEVLSPRDGAIPVAVTVPLWKMWHYRLGTMQEELVGSRGIFLLVGPQHAPVYPIGFQRSPEERQAILALLRN